jgi:hypothetical protein
VKTVEKQRERLGQQCDTVARASRQKERNAAVAPRKADRRFIRRLVACTSNKFKRFRLGDEFDNADRARIASFCRKAEGPHRNLLLRYFFENSDDVLV